MKTFENKPAPISLIIPAYNRAVFIRETIDSALAQPEPFAEIIVVNDGSTDDTLRILEPYENRIRIISTANQGVQAARNLGISASTTELVALCDSDDIIEPGFVSRVTSWMLGHPDTDIFYSNFNVFNENGVQYQKHSTAPFDFFQGADIEGDVYFNIPDLYKRCLSFQPLFHAGLAFKKAFFSRIGGYNSQFRGIVGEDWEFTLRAISLGNVAVCSTPLASVRKHLNNDSGDSMRMNIGDSLILEYALDNHSGANLLKMDILKSIDHRRVLAFNEAFSRGDFEMTGKILPTIKFRPSTLNFKAKQFICELPHFVRKSIWRVSQKSR